MQRTQGAAFSAEKGSSASLAEDGTAASLA